MTMHKNLRIIHILLPDRWFVYIFTGNGLYDLKARFRCFEADDLTFAGLNISSRPIHIKKDRRILGTQGLCLVSIPNNNIVQIYKKVSFISTVIKCLVY